MKKVNRQSNELFSFLKERWKDCSIYIKLAILFILLFTILEMIIPVKSSEKKDLNYNNQKYIRYLVTYKPQIINYLEKNFFINIPIKYTTKYEYYDNCEWNNINPSCAIPF